MASEFRPSKQFIIRGGIAIGIIAIILIAQTPWFRGLFHSKKIVKTAPQTLTLEGLITKDSNGEGIPDWEQVLWGLNPNVAYTDGKPNAEIIKEKQEALGVGDTDTGDANNETDIIAQELFSITTALSQNQNIDDATLQNIADQLGSSVDVASVSNTYSLSDLHTVPTTAQSLAAYYKSVSSVIEKASTSEDDIPVIVQAAETGDYSQLPQLLQTGVTYAGIAKQLSAIPVPIGVAQYQLDIINSFAGMATSFTYLVQMQDNSTEAIIGVALYKVYYTRGQTALINLHIYLTKYGILSS